MSDYFSPMAVFRKTLTSGAKSERLWKQKSVCRGHARTIQRKGQCSCGNQKATLKKYR